MRTRSSIATAAACIALTVWSVAAVPAAAQERTRAASAATATPPALERLTPANTAFIYVDYVTGLDNLMNTIPAEQYRNNIAAFAKTGQLLQVPILVLGEENDYYGTFLPEMRPLIEAGAKRVGRTTVTGYTPETARWLRETGRRNVVIGGISIDNCTMATALDMLRAGYRVFVVTDVSSTNSRLVEDTAIMRLVQAGAVPVTWLNVLTEMGGDFAGPYGQGMMGIIQAHWPASTVGETRDLTPDGRGMQPVTRR